jgi:hypothetical protein
LVHVQEERDLLLGSDRQEVYLLELGDGFQELLVLTRTKSSFTIQLLLTLLVFIERLLVELGR